MQNKPIILIGTVCSYPEGAPIPLREEYFECGLPEQTNQAYGLAKRTLLALARAYRDQHGLKFSYPVLANLYGPGDYFNDPLKSHVIPSLIEKFSKAKEANEKTVTLWGDGTATRSFLYVEDAARLIAENFCQGTYWPEPINFDSGEEISIRDLAWKIAKLVGYEGGLKWDVSKPNGNSRRVMNTEKAQKLFGWKAETFLEEGLFKTVEYYQSLDKTANVA